MSRLKDEALVFAGVIAIVSVLAAFGTARAITTINSTTVIGTSGTSSSDSPYVLTLVVTTQNIFNSSIGDQPAFYVLGPNGLESSANITVPSDQLIELIIVNYDDGSGALTDPQFANVMGVPGGIYVVNNADINSSQGLNGIVVNETSLLMQEDPSLIAHTFTVSGLLNIPIEVSSTTVANFTLTTPGTYVWSCMTACGSGPAGTEGAMITPGWMTGNLVVLPPVTPPSQATSGINAGLITAVIIGTLAIGISIGILFRRPPKMQK